MATKLLCCCDGVDGAPIISSRDAKTLVKRFKYIIIIGSIVIYQILVKIVRNHSIVQELTLVPYFARQVRKSKPLLANKPSTTDRTCNRASRDGDVGYRRLKEIPKSIMYSVWHENEPDSQNAYRPKWTTRRQENSKKKRSNI